MNPTVRDTMRKELARSKGAGFVGLFAAMGFFFVVHWIGSYFPGFMTLWQGRNWFSMLFLALGIGVGLVATALCRTFHADEINELDDDTLKFQHDKMSRDKLRSNIIFYIIVALVVAYLIFKH